MAFAGWGLVRATGEAHERAVWAAQRDARGAALAMRAALTQPAILRLCPDERRFVARGGEVVVDGEVGWLFESQGAQLDSLTRERLADVQRLEFAVGDRELARRRMQDVLARLDPDQPSSWPVLAAAAWQAHRRDDREAMTSLLATVEPRLRALEPGRLGDRRCADALASVTLLRAAQPGFVPTATWRELLACLPHDVADATLRRLAERGHQLPEVRARADRLSRRRALLRRAARLLREATALQPAQAFEGEVALWFVTDAERGDGEGALVAPTLLAELPGIGTTRPAVAGLPPVPDVGELCFEARADAATVLSPIAWIAPTTVPALPWYARPFAVWSLGAVLLLTFGGSVWTTLRGLRRENAAMHARAEFLAGVTHELKTPVASLRLIADVLHDDDVRPERQREYFAMMAGETARLSTLVDNVLDLGQLERGERAYDLRHDDAADVVREAVRTYAPLAERHGLAVALREGPAVATTRLDRGAITQTLLNLFENARKYASDGGRVDVRTEAADGRFVVEVRDHGPGVPDHEREPIFERFRRGEAQRSGAVAGVGLGLFLSRAIVEHHGGTLTCARPADGRGAAFVMALPMPTTEEPRA